MKQKRRKFHHLFLSLFATLFLFSSIVHPTLTSALSSDEIQSQIDKLKDEKSSIENQIKDIQEQHQKNENEISKLLVEKSVIDQEIQLITEEIRNINEQIKAYSSLIADKQQELDSAQKKQQELNNAYKDRIRAMEEYGEISYWSVIFKANSLSDMLDRIAMASEIAAADNKKLKELSDAAKQVEETQNSLLIEKDNIEKARDEAQLKESELQDKKAESELMLQDLLSKSHNLAQLEADFEEQEELFLKEILEKEVEYDDAKQKEWQEYMNSLHKPQEKPSKPGKDDIQDENNTNDTNEEQTTEKPTRPDTQQDTKPDENKEQQVEQEQSKPPEIDNSVWYKPCDYILLTSPFGYRDAPTAGASTFHQGVDLAGPSGTPIYSSRGGQVVISGYSSTAGNYVKIDHLDGYSSVYMHLTNYTVSRGQFVAPNELIGYMGSTGVSTGPHLHFGIAYKGQYVDPSKFIKLNLWG